MVPSKPKMTFSAAYEELQQITREFEHNELDLEKSIPKFKRATELVKFLQAELKKMETQIEEINLDNEPESKAVQTPLTPEEPDQTEIPF
jgi:exodeoxyribonuclease VII small subunit